MREAALLIEGLVCPACVWLNEQTVARIPGVVDVGINFATRRARVRWDARRTPLSKIVDAIAAIGYGARPYDAAAAEALRLRERRALLKRLAVAGLSMMQVMMYAVPMYLATEGEMTADIARLMSIASLLLTLPVMLYSATPFYRGAWRDARAGRLGMDVPIVIGIIVTFIASAYVTLAGTGGEVFFDSLSMFVFLLLAARYFELIARSRAARATEELVRLAPDEAIRLPRYPAPDEESVPSAALATGDHVLVRAGAIAPADGIIVQGTTRFDEAALTGESRPVPKSIDASILAGTTNVGNPVVMRIEHVGADTWLAGVARLVERAAREKPRLVQIADRYAAVFVFVILLLAGAAAWFWWSTDATRALWVAVSILIVTCPCALSLATPISLTAAAGALAQSGVLPVRSDVIETLARVDTVVFDKTGTLTEGALRCTDVVPLGSIGTGEALRIAARLEARAAHPIARAIVEAAGGEIEPVDVEEFSGRGVEGVVEGCRTRAGSIDFVRFVQPTALPPLDASIVDQDRTIAALADERGWIALFVFEDSLRPEAAGTIAALGTLGLRVALLSGDTPAAVAACAEHVGIASFAGACTPETKLERVREMQRDGAIVAMVGDGSNDSPVLAQAHVSFALGSGTALAHSRADVVLLQNRLDGITMAIDTARRARRIVRQNLAWAFAYNLAAVPLAAVGWMPPWLAGLGMALSSLLVVMNSLRLVRPRPVSDHDAQAAPVAMSLVSPARAR